jgi:glutaredoxin
MDILIPQSNIITIYSKSGCPNCVTIKKLLKEKQLLFEIIDCDEYILENRDEFVKFMNNITGRENNVFPMVFDDNKFIGGFSETKKYIETILNFNYTF